MIVGHIGGGSAASYEIQKSLRFRSSNNAQLTRTPSVAGSKTQMTFSFWVKPSLASNKCLFGSALSGSQIDAIGFDFGYGYGSERLHVISAHGSLIISVMPSRRFRDPSAWYHIVVVIDTPNATAADRVRIYTNGVRETAFDIASYPSQNYQFQYWNNTHSNTIGQLGPYYGSYQFDGYLAEVRVIDGQALDASYFGQVSAETGAWIPKKYTGTYGTNGFYLPFNDGSTLANLTADRSGNGNNWTANNISLTAGSSYDWMDDTPTNNFAVLNAVYAGRSTLTNGNLTASGTTDLPTIIPDSGAWYFERGGVSQTWTPPAAFPSGSGDYNFGQRPWQSTGPTGGQKALCTNNLPAPSILNPKKHFDIRTRVGNGATQVQTGMLFQPYFKWTKNRQSANNNVLTDGVRGANQFLYSNTTGSEATASGNSLDANGYTLGASVEVNANGETYVDWLWKAGGVPVTNNDGSIQSQVSANPQAGFSIVTYTGNATVGATVGHGLGVVPKLVIVKRRDLVSDWAVSHASLPLNSDTLYLDLTVTTGTFPNRFDRTGFTSAVFKTGTQAIPNEVNGSGANFVAYCFAEIPGYSKIGSYTGNGSADGTFVYCGFRPKYVLIKCINAAGTYWHVFDSARDTYNPENLMLFPNGNDAESAASSYGRNLDFTANGFKLRGADGHVNGAYQYIFYAIAEQPFQFANAR